MSHVEHPELPEVWEIENRRRSAAMLTPQQPCLDREQAIAVFEQLIAALLEVKRLNGPPSE